jgi:hypothetical protein
VKEFVQLGQQLYLGVYGVEREEKIINSLVVNQLCLVMKKNINSIINNIYQNSSYIYNFPGTCVRSV